MMLLLLCLATPAAEGARVYGTIYDLSLEPVEGAVVEVDSSPIQRYISEDGTYSLELPPGTYTISAQQMRDTTVLASVSEELAIEEQEGNFILDLILYPEVVEEGELYDPAALSSVEQDFGGSRNMNLYHLLISLAVVVLSVGFILFFTRRISSRLDLQSAVIRVLKGRSSGQQSPESGNLPEDLEQVRGILIEEGGRMTQKALREKLPYSEAKVSLMVSELEGRGVIRKFKRGRGNVLVLSGGGGKENRQF